MSPHLPTSTPSLPEDMLESSWLHFFGTLPIEDMDTPSKIFYWEFFSDLALIVAPSAIAPLLVEPLGFADFALIYFSLVNGWLLYVHHFKGRFQEQSRVHAVLQWIFIVSLLGGVYNCYSLSRQADWSEMELTIIFQRLSVCMGFLRLAVLIMFVRVAVHVCRAASFCMLVTFFLANSFMCFILASISDRNSIVILWSIAALIETLMDFFVALCLSHRLHVPVAISLTMDRFWAVILAPLGSICMTAFLYNLSGDEDDVSGLVFRASAVILLALFGLLYYNLKESVSSRLRRCHRILQTLGLLHLKLLGLALWTVGANLWVLIQLLAAPDVRVKNIRHHADLLALSVMFALILLFAWKSCNGRPYELGEIIWIFLINGSFAFGTMVPLQNSHLKLLTLNVILVAVLNLVEYWSQFHDAGQFLSNRLSTSIIATVLPTAVANGSRSPPIDGSERQTLLPTHGDTRDAIPSEYSSLSSTIDP